MKKILPESAKKGFSLVVAIAQFGGIYLVGPTATEYPAMLSEIFLPEFFNCVPSKKSVLKRIPVYVIHADTQLGLYGAAYYMVNEKNIFE